MMKRGPILLVLALIFFSCKDDQRISFNQQIRPILNDNCLVCHGGVKQLGGFSLLFPETAFGTTESGKPAIVPGSHNKSELYKRLVHHDPEERMPQEGPALDQQEIALIANWIDQGAQWEDHWAYMAPQSAPLPQQTSPWVKSNIDLFILQELTKMDLVPADQADPATLARRVSLDLTGLPPETELLQDFLKENSNESYNRLVDSLLASPHYGERWAAMWLDLARYADSNGYEADAHRNIWRYRDWVIQAFNKDMPFDQFTIEQLAGDLLPDPSRDQLIATAFHRNTMNNTEGGTIDEEFRIASVLDRLNATFEVWQSTSIGCVQCHSHPYDPFKHEEYYQLMAYFNNTQDADINSMAPTLPTWEPLDADSIREIIGFVRQLDGIQSPDSNAPLQTQISQALFPMLIPQWCDDFQNVLLYNKGSVSNHVYNYSDGLQKKLFFQFSNIQLEGLTEIRYNFATKGTDARLKVYQDSINGHLLQQVDFPMTTLDEVEINNETYVKESYPVNTSNGIRHLVFELINTTKKAPDGLVTIAEIELIYEDGSTNSELEKFRKQLVKLKQKADLTPIMRKKNPGFMRVTNVFDRGNWLVQKEEVDPRLPQTLEPENSKIGSDRLAFAQWLVGKENPLTARVIVNRLWEQLFGTGIVLTVEDFGTQAEAATHPQLLDYLALRLMNEHQWSIKALLKEIVLSASYRQSSQVTSKKLQLDPYNQLLSRGPRFRLSAEQIRDQSLAVSGLLDKTIGGKSVMPPQPEGIWQVIYGSQEWKTEEGDSHRRGLYTYWKRTSPYPSMMSFDSPSREFCVSRRIRTNTPLQALVTMNDPVFVEAAQALAEKMNSAGTDIKQSISQGYYLALMQEPPPKTLAVLEELYQEAVQAQSSVKIRPVISKENEREPVDPMTVVANAIMNLDSFLMKE